MWTQGQVEGLDKEGIAAAHIFNIYPLTLDNQILEIICCN
ncbi:MAG: hypothetical protein A4E53_00093 [Pelotomaculum sp. PtaB.Bin104]|nr:MAG: hypothetical protein A4E53_00093 [Pelotomaculum sp. PtaB.Bin104]